MLKLVVVVVDKVLVFVWASALVVVDKVFVLASVVVVERIERQ